MGTKEIYDRYKELCESDKFICSKSELDEFMLCGLIIETGKNKYVLRNTDIKNITVIKDLNYNFDIDFNKLLDIDLKPYNTNKVYYMTETTFNKYKEDNLIVEQNGHNYYRLFAGELWLVKIL